MNTKRFLTLVLLVVLALGLSVTMARAQDPVVIKIASQSPLSGGQAVLGVGLRNGTELAIEQLGGNLEAMGYDIQFVPFDDQATPDVGVANAQQIVADEAIIAVVGHFNSGVAIPSSEVYVQSNLVMVSPANTNPRVTDRGLFTVNRVCGRDDAQGTTGANFAASLEGVGSVYILHDTTAYGQGVAEFFRDAAEANGLTVLGFEGTEERSNFDGIIQPLLALAPDLVYMGGIYDQFGVFVNQLAAAGYAGILMGPDGLDSPEYAALAGEAAVNTYYTSAAGPASVFPAAEQLIADYSAAGYGDITPYVAESYDAAAIIIHAIERAAAAATRAAGGVVTAPSRLAVAIEVRSTTGYEGVTGSITFDANGDRDEANYFVLQVGSADPAAWGSNQILQQLAIPSPLHAAEMEMMMSQ
jgi:branched-chain amino acid transport system substrate-binding protein